MECFVASYREGTDKLSIPFILSSLNKATASTTSIKGENEETLALAQRILRERFYSLEILSPTGIQEGEEKNAMVMSSTLEDNLARINTLSAQNKSLKEKYTQVARSESGRYYSSAERDEKDIAKKALKQLVYKAKQMTSYCITLKEQYDAELKEITDKVEDLTVRANTSSADSPSVELLCQTLLEAKNNLGSELKHPRGASYLTYQRFKSTLSSVNEREAALVIDKQDIQNDFVDLTSTFGGECIAATQASTLAKLDAVKEPLTQAGIAAQRFETDNLDTLQRLERNYRKEQLVKRVLKFIKHQIFSEENITDFWHEQVTVILGLGGEPVNGVKVPHGAAFVINRLAKVENIDALSMTEAVALLTGVKGEAGAEEDGIKGILAKRQAMGKRLNVRQQSTTQQMYDLAESVTDVDALTDEHVTNFERRVKEGIVDKRNPSKILKLRFTDEQPVVTAMATPLVSSPIPISRRTRS